MIVAIGRIVMIGRIGTMGTIVAIVTNSEPAEDGLSLVRSKLGEQDAPDRFVSPKQATPFGLMRPRMPAPTVTWRVICLTKSKDVPR
jgi:hypothetical protein